MSNAVFLRPDENGNWGKVGTDAAGSVSEELVFQSGATAVGDGTVQDVSGYTSLRVFVTIGSVSNTVTGQGSNDGVTYYTQVPITSSTSGISASGTYIYNVSGFKFFRLRVSTYVSGSVDVTGYATMADYTPPATTGSFGALDTNSQNGVLLGVGSYNLLFDGTNWTRQRTSSAVGDGVTGTGSLSVGSMGFNGTTWDRVRTVSAGDGIVTGLMANGLYVYDPVSLQFNRARAASQTDNSTSGTAMLAVGNYAYNGALLDRVRVGKVYKYIEYLNLANATATTVWTPAAGKKFRLMGVQVGTSSGSNALVHLRDGAAGSGTVFHTIRTNTADTKDFSFGNGYLSGLADRVLEIYNATGATCSVWVTAWGTEE